MSCQNSRMMVKAKWPSLRTRKTSTHFLMMHMTSLMKRLAYCLHMLHESPQRCCCSLPPGNMHSLEQLCDLIESNFHDFDPEPLDKKLLKQRKTPQESPTNFWERFHVLHFEAPKG